MIRTRAFVSSRCRFSTAVSECATSSAINSSTLSQCDPDPAVRWRATLLLVKTHLGSNDAIAFRLLAEMVRDEILDEDTRVGCYHYLRSVVGDITEGPLSSMADIDWEFVDQFCRQAHANCTRITKNCGRIAHDLQRFSGSAIFGWWTDVSGSGARSRFRERESATSTRPTPFVPLPKRLAARPERRSSAQRRRTLASRSPLSHAARRDDRQLPIPRRGARFPVAAVRPTDRRRVGKPWRMARLARAGLIAPMSMIRLALVEHFA